MDGAHDGSISFSTALDNKRLEKELAGLTKKIEKKTQDIAKLTQRRDAVKGNALFDGSALDAEKAKLQEIKDRLADVRAMAKDKSVSPAQRDGAKELIPSLQEELSDQKDRVRGLQAEWNKLQNAAERYDVRIAEATAELERQKRTAGQIQEKLDQNSGEGAQERMAAYLKENSAMYKQITGMVEATANVSAVLQGLAAVTGSGKLSGAFQTASAAIGGFGTALSGVAARAMPFLAIATAILGILKKLRDAAAEFAVGFTNALKRGAASVYSFSSSVARNFVAALKAIGKLSASFVKTVTGITKNIVQLAGRLNAFSRMAETLGGAFKRLGSTIKSALVFSVIYKGLSLLKEQISSYLMVNEQFSTALRRLQGTFLTAFQPIYEVAVPALTALVNALTHAIAVLAQFFAGLFGTTAKKAQANAKALYSEAKALKATGKAAKEAAGSLAGFDEVNPIQTEDKSGGDGSAPDTGALFDYDYEETPFASWGEAFNAFLDNLLDGVPRLEAAFKRIAGALNDWSKKLYDMFTFPDVPDKVKQLGRDLADALNGLVDQIDWNLLGHALGAGLNLALNFLTSFLFRFNWINLGRELAGFINGLAGEVDWYEFGRLLWAGFKIGLEVLAGFLAGLDMPLLAAAASGIAQGFFDEMERTIREIPWLNIGRQIAVFLNNIQWYEVITSAADAIHAGITALYKLVRGFIGRLEWDGVAEQIYTAINDSLGNEALLDKSGEVFSSLFIHIFNFCRAVIAGIEWETLGADIAAFILGFDWAGALGGLADLIAAGINAAVQLARGSLDSILPEVQGIAGDVVFRLREAVSSVEWSELGSVIGDGVKAALLFVAGLLSPDLFYEAGQAIGDILIGLDWAGIVGGLAEALANGIQSAVAAASGFLDSVQPNLQEIAEGVAQKINEFVANVDWAELGRTIHDGIDAALNFLITILDNLDWDEIGGAIVDFLTGLDWGSLLEKWGTVVGKAIGGALKGIDLGDIISFGGDIVGGMIQGMLNKWDESGGIVGWIKRKLFSPFVEEFCDLFGIHSPSTVMEEQGGYLIAGLLNGIEDAWRDIVDSFGKKLTDLQKNLSDAWTSIKDTASQMWSTINTTLGGAWDTLKSTASSKFEGIRSSISNVWTGLVSSASSWGRDICSNIASGISGAIGRVTSAVSSVANKISSFLHFSEPDEGPLSNFHTYMPDMLELMAEGIRDNTDLAVNAASKLADSVANTLSGKSIGVNVSAMPDFANYSIPDIAMGTVVPGNREFMSILVDRDTGDGQQINPETGDDEIAGLLQAILDAVKKGHIILVDGEVLGRATQKSLNNITTKTGKFALTL